ncbi:MAG: DNA repair protein RecO [Verrucomicrobiota bacterium]|nr:DNA repair protein RecO [Limisphaera sp.]MDW8382336.1 DNA repair protein RecO [Verrucomicrobiota bacterium]
MDERAQGLIVRTLPLTETSLIVHWITREHGRLTTVARGARRPRSPFSGRLDLFCLHELVFHRSRRSELHLLREVCLLSAHPGLRTDPDRLRLACEAVRRLEQATEPESPLPAAFDLLMGLLQYLEVHPARGRLRLAFELRLLTLLGWDPSRLMQRLSPRAQELAGALFTRAWGELDTLSPWPEVVQEVRQFLDRFWRMEVGIVCSTFEVGFEAKGPGEGRQPGADRT